MRQQRIMIIEDDGDMSAYIDLFLSTIGFTVLQGPPTPDIVEAVTTAEPDLVLLDHHLDNALSGWDIAVLLHEHSAMATIPCILFSADPFVLKRHQDEMQTMGGDVLAKPFLVLDLLCMIDALTTPGHTGLTA